MYLTKTEVAVAVQNAFRLTCPGQNIRVLAGGSGRTWFLTFTIFFVKGTGHVRHVSIIFLIKRFERAALSVVQAIFLFWRYPILKYQ